MMNLVKDYKQYFTPQKLAKYMVSIIPEKIITNVIDLSMGECGLLEEARERWNNAELYGVDIDKILIKRIRIKSPYINTFHGDSLSCKLDKWGKYNNIVTGKGFDLAIANPPFNYFDQKYVLIQDEYIDIVRSNGYICIILPYGFCRPILILNLEWSYLKKSKF